MKKYILMAILMTLSMMAYSQEEELPYADISALDDNYTAGAVMARYIDGLGFRYYWSTEGLNKKDYDYKITDESRSTGETIRHIHGLSVTINNAATGTTNSRQDFSDRDIVEIRKMTLHNFKNAADIFRESEDISEHKILFDGREVPLWNLMNGPIADALWHCGQIASFRRASGNPINPNISHFNGTIRTN